MRILVLGASGVAGRSLVPHLHDAGHDVAAQASTMSRLRPLADAGATPVPADATGPQVLRKLLYGRDAVYDLRIPIPLTDRAVIPRAWHQYARLRGAGCGAVVDAALEVGVPRVIRDTVTMVYASGGDNWLDENHPARTHGRPRREKSLRMNGQAHARPSHHARGSGPLTRLSPAREARGRMPLSALSGIPPLWLWRSRVRLEEERTLCRSASRGDRVDPHSSHRCTRGGSFRARTRSAGHCGSGSARTRSVRSDWAPTDSRVRILWALLLT